MKRFLRKGLLICGTVACAATLCAFFAACTPKPEQPVYEKTPVAHSANGGSEEGHLWNENNQCSVCGYMLNPTEGLHFVLNGDGESYSVALGRNDGDEFVGEEGIDGVEKIVIPAYFEGKPVTRIGGYSESLFWAGAFTSLVVPNTIKQMDEYSFYYCQSLKTVYIGCNIGESMFFQCPAIENAVLAPDVKEIGKCAFYQNENLKEINFPYGLTKIGNQAFCNDRSLEKAIIPSTVKQIENYAFNDCTALKELTLSEGLETIGLQAFAFCKALTSVRIPDSVTELGENAFAYCEGVTDLKIGAGLSSLPDDVFSAMSSLKKVEIPAGITEISASAFYGCGKLIEVFNRSQVAAENVFSGALNIYTPSAGSAGEFFKEGSFEFYKAKGETYLIEYTGEESSVVLPDTAGGGNYKIYRAAFLENALTEITFGSGVTEIGAAAFAGCVSLQSVVIPANIKTIGVEAFYRCSSLKSVTFENLSGWKLYKSGADKTPASFSVDNAEINAKNLTQYKSIFGGSGYADHMWIREN